ncbi:MAG TPA: dihydrodipicolinate synthase family protein [Blastocatellia bacterium]
MRIRLQGIFPPLTTPFDDEGRLDLAALASNVARYNETRLAGYVALGSNGEAVHLSTNERISVFQTVKRAAASDKVIVAGINELSTLAAIEGAKYAHDCGADAALVITPYFYKGQMTQEVLKGHFLEVADRSPIPVLVYNIPQNTGVVIQPATIAELAAHENIVGTKDSSGDMGALASTMRLSPNNFSVLTGNAGILYPALMMGASGGILAMACLSPSSCLELYDAALAGQSEQARSLQNRISPISSLVTSGLGVPGLKAALDLAGYAGGRARAPMPAVRLADVEKIKTAMRSSELFP